MGNQLEQALLEIQGEHGELRNKEKELWKHKVTSAYDELQDRKKNIERSKVIDLDSMAVDKLNEARAEGRAFLENAKNAKAFINNDFKGKVPYFAGNLILICGKTGTGKTTLTANLAYHDLVQGGSPLVISNEEKISDVYNRVTCLLRGWSYSNQDQFTTEQLDTFDSMMVKLAERMTVIDDKYCGGEGQTTTLEGIKGTLEALLVSKRKYSVIVIDYYQNIKSSLNMPGLDQYQVQERLAAFLDQFKNRYMAPIVLLAQLKDGKDLPFKEAIEGRKAVHNPCTCTIEMVLEKEQLKTEWKIHKSRWNNANGETVSTGFEKGKYIPYTPEFRNQVELRNQRKEQQKLLKEVFDAKE